MDVHFAYIYTPDKEPPRFEFCPSTRTNTTEPGQAAAVVAWEDPKATDNSNLEPNVTCDSKTGTPFPIGQTKVNCIAEDKSGNRGECNFYVNVKGTPL